MNKKNSRCFQGKLPHSARHTIGKYIMEKIKNVMVVQRVLGHKNAAYILQYSRISTKEWQNMIDAG